MQNALHKIKWLIKRNSRTKKKWNQWADTPIDPYLTIRYIPAFYVTKSIPKAFTSLREDAEWWCSNELKNFGAKGYLNWTRREQTFFEKGGTNLWRCSATFEEPPVSSWMKVSGSSQKFIFKEELTSIVKSNKRRYDHEQEKNTQRMKKKKPANVLNSFWN